MLRRPQTADAPAARRRDAGGAAGRRRRRARRLEIAPNDPLLALPPERARGRRLDQLELDSPALEQMRAAGRHAGRPARHAGRADRHAQPRPAALRPGVLDRRPARCSTTWPRRPRRRCRVGQLVREQEAEARARERIEQELEVAQLIQQNFLPKQLPELPGWQRRRLLPAGARGRRRLLRLHRAARAARSASSSAT